jgi:hypothetical protein
MPMIKLSVKGLADFMTANAARQRRILREHKFPRLDEARAKIVYYREARDHIAAYHRRGHRPEWMAAKADDLLQLAAADRSVTGQRLRHNARALIHYEAHFARRGFAVQPDLRLSLQLGVVRVSVVPDLHVVEKRKEKIIKLEFGVNPPTRDSVRIISQVMYEAARGHIPHLTNRSILFLDVPRGNEHHGARAGARTLGEIEAACQNIQGIWPTIQ